MFGKISRAIEWLVNPRWLRRYNLHCDMSASAEFLGKNHGSLAVAFDEMTRLAQIPAGVLHAVGRDRQNIATVYIDTRATTTEKVVADFGLHGLILHE
jgi:hypothetical protein